MDPSTVTRWSDEILEWFAVWTHCHTDEVTNGCWGGSSFGHLARIAAAYGATGVALNNHATSPVDPVPNPSAGVLAELSAHRRAVLQAAGRTAVPVFPGFELNLLAAGLDVLPEQIGRGYYLAGHHHGLTRAYAANPRTITDQLIAVVATPGLAGLAHPMRGLDPAIAQHISWRRVLEAVTRAGRVVELNYNSWWKEVGRPEAQRVKDPAGSETAKHAFDRWLTWLRFVAKSDALLAIGHDLHNDGMVPGCPVEEWNADWLYELSGLTNFLAILKAVGITPDRVVNADLRRFAAFYDRVNDPIAA